MTSVENLRLAVAAWRLHLGEKAVLCGTAAQQRYGTCTTGVERSIAAAVRPRTVEDVVAVVEIARRESVPLYPISTGHNWGYGSATPVVDGCAVLDLSRLNRIIGLDAELGLVTIEPGVTQQDLHNYLVRHGLPFLVPVTGGGPDCSLIGNALERGYGITPYADHFAAVTAIGAVLPDGRIYRSALSELGGGVVDQVFKWGIGPYVDGLFAQGSFAVVTQMTIALAPRPESIAAFFFGVADDEELGPAVAAVQRILRALGGVTGSVNLMNARRVLAMIAPYPQTAVPEGGILPPELIAALTAQHRMMAWNGLGALYGQAAVVRAARRAVRKILGPAVARLAFLTPHSAVRANRLLSGLPLLRHGRLAARARALDAALQLITGRPSRVALPLAYWRSPTRPGLESDMDPDRDGCGLIWYSPLVPMKADRVRRFVELIGHICGSHGIEPLITLTSLSERCFDSSVPLLFNRRDAGQAARAQSCYRALFEAGQREGFLPYRMSSHAMDWITRSATPFWDVVAALKTAVDPTGMELSVEE
jgi:4-cresol dehydrogenase (hydroxylating) flavoprotein subunit